jgi:hypothetical protein
MEKKPPENGELDSPNSSSCFKFIDTFRTDDVGQHNNRGEPWAKSFDNGNDIGKREHTTPLD